MSDILKEAGLNEGQIKLLEGAWRYQGSHITNHDGVPNESMNTEINIKDDPLLVKAINDIKDGYFKLYFEVLGVKKQYKEVPWSSYIVGGKKYQSAKQLGDEMDRRLIIQNRDCFERLQQQDYGYSPEEKQKILSDAHCEDNEYIGEPLGKRDAYIILGKIIGSSLDSFVAITEDRNLIDVPKSFDPDSIKQR